MIDHRLASRQNNNIPNLLEVIEILDQEAILSDTYQEQELLGYYNSLATDLSVNEQYQ